MVPCLGTVGEQKTKPTQHGVRELRSVGLSPDVIFCRSSDTLLQSTKQKISNFCHVQPECVLGVHDVSNIYHVPQLLIEQNFHGIVAEKLQLKYAFPSGDSSPQMLAWNGMARIVDEVTDEVKIALVGKYTGLQDSYASVIKALKHAAIAIKKMLVIEWIEATNLELQTKEKKPEVYKGAWDTLRSVNGVLVPGGFGDRGVEGKILAANYARENKVPYLGICLGMQIMVIEAARNLCNIEDATSTEFDKETSTPVIIFMPEINPNQMGATMRLGSRKTIFRSKPEWKDEVSTQLRLYTLL